MKNTIPIAVTCLFVSVIGLLVVGSFAMRAMAWKGAENWDQLWVYLLGVPIVCVQAVIVLVVMYLTRHAERATMLPLRWGSFAILVVTVVAGYFGLNT